MKVQNLQKLLFPWFSKLPIRYISDIILDSRSVSLDSLFIAISGFKTHGCLYITDAIYKGAAAIITQCHDDLIDRYISYSHDIPILYFKSVDQYLSKIAGRFFYHPSKFLRLVGVTGTNGKTTISHLLSNWVLLLGELSAVMGTIGHGIFDNTESYNCTTCSAIDTQRILATLRNKDVTFISMEVSSHGLSQYRVDDLYFDAAIFTNLSHDHLDYHGSIINYKLSKLRLFHELKVKNYIVNFDDIVGRELAFTLSNAVLVMINSIVPKDWQGQWLRAIKICYRNNITSIVFNSSWGSGILHTKLLGKFNVINILLAMTTLLILKYPLSLLLGTSIRLKPICGRMEVFNVSNYPKVIVDYAHNPDALKNLLISARLYCNGNLWCVFGCGGNRDYSKRALMGRIAEQYADNIIITNDNPRSENPNNIINDIKQGLLNPLSTKVIICRNAAISNAIRYADLNDLVLIVGKGHENYQIINNEKLYYSDRDTIKSILGIT